MKRFTGEENKKKIVLQFVSILKRLRTKFLITWKKATIVCTTTASLVNVNHRHHHWRSHRRLMSSKIGAQLSSSGTATTTQFLQSCLFSPIRLFFSVFYVKITTTFSRLLSLVTRIFTSFKCWEFSTLFFKCL